MSIASEREQLIHSYYIWTQVQLRSDQERKVNGVETEVVDAVDVAIWGTADLACPEGVACTGGVALMEGENSSS